MSSTVTYLESLRSTLHAVMEQDPTVVVLGEDILDPYGGAFKVTQGLSTRFPNRVFTTPICEATIVGIGTGLALRGLRPVAEIMFGDFITLAADQIINHAAKFHDMYGGAVDVPLVIRTPMGGGRGYGPTHSQSLEKLFLGVPGLGIVAPSHFHNAGDLLKRAILDHVPILFVEHKLLYPERLFLDSGSGLWRDEVPELGSYPTVLVRNYEHLEPDVTVVTYGGMSRLVPHLLATLAEEEIRVLVCMPSSLQPLPVDTIVSSARQSKRVVVVEDGTMGFGWGAEVASAIYDELLDVLERPIRRVAALNTVIPASKALEEAVLVSERIINSAILEVML